MLKAVLYYPTIKDLLNFSTEKFKPIYNLYPQIKFIYAENISQFESEIVDADYIFAVKVTTEQYYTAKKLKAIFCYAAGKEWISLAAINGVRCYFGQFHGQLMAESLPEKSELWEAPNLLIMPHISAFYHNYIDLYLDELPNHINDELIYQNLQI